MDQSNTHTNTIKKVSEETSGSAGPRQKLGNAPSMDNTSRTLSHDSGGPRYLGQSGGGRSEEGNSGEGEGKESREESSGFLDYKSII